MSLENKLIIVKDRDTGVERERFIANYPNIRTLRGFLSGEWDLSLFSDCFKGRNSLGDVDGTIEINGHTLVLEFKGSIRAMNRGQVLKSIRQAKYSNITTLFVFGKQNVPESYLEVMPDSESEDGFSFSVAEDAPMDVLKDKIKQWASDTEKNNLVKSKTDEWNKVQEVLSALYY